MAKQSVAVVTLPGRYNYGNRLQNYATVRILEALGFQATTLLLDGRYAHVGAFVRQAKRMLGHGSIDKEESSSAERLAAFDRFNAHISIQYFSHVGRDIKDDFTYFVVGSDQVWNPVFITPNDDWYYLKFVNPNQRVALAPSIGIESLSALQARRLAWGVKGFSRLSIREQRGAELIQQYSGRTAAVICDPTLVIPRDAWIDVADDRLVPDSQYVFTYLLGGLTGSARTVLDSVTCNGELSVLSLSDREGVGELPAGPAEFISFIMHAKHVVTDSFHAAVFASIMGTPLTIVRRSGSEKMFSRLQTLSETLGISNKIFNGSLDLSCSADYEGVEQAIQMEREKYLDFAGACLVD